VGPTSQAPRLDEARHDALYEMEIALTRAFEHDPGAGPPPPWLADALFRHLLVDVAGNTHRAEISIDELFDWRTPHGRQGLVELRAFEMPPHPRMMVAQAQLVRALVAALAQEPYRAPLVRWGQELHDRFLLPTWLWQDFEDVLAFLDSRGLPHPAEVYRAFLGLRFRAWAPPHSLHPHLGIHHPIRLDVVDRWARRSLGACAYHVWHPEGRAYATPPLTRFEAAARRAQRFTIEGPAPWPVTVLSTSPAPGPSTDAGSARPAAPAGDTPWTLDLRRLPGDHPPPPPPDE